ncbi:MAG TPA: acyl-CoA thioesterase domain-containing protein [Pseudonocardia sp.]|nr:acyl-CoA thioesterase domain-containing protein [Pseudonocardia sp.]
MTDYAAWWDAILTLDETAPDEFTAAPAPSAVGRLYGGQIAAQCLVAAAATVDPERLPHSSYTSYLRGGNEAKPVEYRVQRLRDSRTLSTRLVLAEQEGRTLASATVSFQVPGEAIEHETSVAAPAPDPESLPSRPEALAAEFGDRIPANAGPGLPVDVRYIDHMPWTVPVEGAPPRNRLWTRALAALPDAPHLHAAALAYVSDFPMYEPVLFPGGMDWKRMISGDGVYGASLDHALWFHRPARLDEWVLLEQVAPIATRSRALCRAEAHVPGIGLVATIVQEMTWVQAAPR